MTTPAKITIPEGAETKPFEENLADFSQQATPYIALFHEFLKTYNPVGYVSFTEVYKSVEKYKPVIDTSFDGLLVRADEDEEGEVEEFVIPMVYFEDPEIWEADMLTEIADDFAHVAEILLTPEAIDPQRVVQVIPAEGNRLVAIVRNEKANNPKVCTYLLNLNTSTVEQSF